MDKEPVVYFGIQLRVLPDNGLRMMVGIYNEGKDELFSQEVRVKEFGRGMVEEFSMDGEIYMDRIPNCPWWLRVILHRILENYVHGL